MQVFLYGVLITIASFVAKPCIAQTSPQIQVVDAENYSFEKAGKLPQQIKEASGLLIYGDDSFWTHNDGGLPVIYNIDAKGKLLKTQYLNHKNKGWEDLARDRFGHMYIGGFGNNKNDKIDLKIYKLPHPDSISTTSHTAEIISYRYEDQKEYPPEASQRNFDVDAFICVNDSLYLFTKNRTKPYNGIINIYALPTTAGKYTARKIDSFILTEGSGMSNWITGADISPDGSTIALLFHDKILLIRQFTNHLFSSGDFIQINLNHFSHKAGVTFADNYTLYIVDELEMDLIGGYLYQLKIKPNTFK